MSPEKRQSIYDAFGTPSPSKTPRAALPRSNISSPTPVPRRSSQDGLQTPSSRGESDIEGQATSRKRRSSVCLNALQSEQDTQSPPPSHRPSTPKRPRLLGVQWDCDDKMGTGVQAGVGPGTAANNQFPPSSSSTVPHPLPTPRFLARKMVIRKAKPNLRLSQPVASGSDVTLDMVPRLAMEIDGPEYHTPLRQPGQVHSSPIGRLAPPLLARSPQRKNADNAIARANL